MKKYSLAIVLLITSFIYSCNDDDIRNIDPDDTLVSDYYENEGQFKEALLGMYMTFFDSGYYSGDASARDIIIVGDLLSDNLVLNPGGRQTNAAAHNWQYDNFAPSGGLYETSYRMISRANALMMNLDNIDLIQDDLVDPNLKQHIRGHALAMRGLAHFEVARHYLKIPTQSGDANNFVGIPYVETYDPYQQPARLENVAAVYQKIVADLTQALQDIPENNVGSPMTSGLYIFDANAQQPDFPAGYEKTLLTKNAVRALLSRVYLYMGDYAKVIEYATPVVNSIAPCPSASLQQLWRSQTNDGVIFQRVVLNVDDVAVGTNYSQGIGGAMVAEYVVDKAFYDTFLPTESQRRDASIQAIPSLNIYAVKKYLQSTFGAGIQHGRYLRVEEVILNLAEAQFLSGDQVGALSTLNRLRDVRYTSYAGGESGDGLFDALQSERRKELCFETGDRWFTLKRLQGVSGIPSIYAQGVVRAGNGQFMDGSGTVPPGQILPPSSPKWQFPLTQDQLNRNPNMTQTPGY